MRKLLFSVLVAVATLPGEFSRAPWLDAGYTAGGVDALPDGHMQKVGSGLKLVTPLNAP
jgi:hypothetical protein